MMSSLVSNTNAMYKSYIKHHKKDLSSKEEQKQGGTSRRRPIDLRSACSVMTQMQANGHSCMRAARTRGQNEVENSELIGIYGCKNSSNSIGFCRARRIAPLYTVLLFLFLVCLAAEIANAIKLVPEGREKFFWSGEQFLITCQNHNNIKNVKIRWHGPNGAFITDDRKQRVHVESNGVHSSRLVVQNATAGLDDGQYKCTIGSSDDRQPRETLEFVLRLLQATSFKDTPKHLVLPASNSQPALIQCQVEFDPNVISGTVNWYRDNVPIDMLNDSAIRVLEYEPSRGSSELQILPLRRDHEGTYQCKAQAVTSRLSKISEHTIGLEVNFAPSFETETEAIWVESGRSLAARSHLHTGHQLTQTRARGGGRLGHPKHQQTYGDFNGQEPNNNNNNNNSSTPTSVRVELRCSCQANPPASILWSTSSNPRYVVQKGSPEYVYEQPTQEIDGHNTTSVLLINYSLDPNWDYRRETYTCSASNKLGKASRKYTIEQGDPPPAFNVDPKGGRYNPKTSMFSFILLGPNFNPSEGINSQQDHRERSQAEIVPSIDKFRIRAEMATGPAGQSLSNGIGNQHYQHQQVSLGHELSRSSYLKRQSEPSVTWSLQNQDGGQTVEMDRQKMSRGEPQNITVKLAEIPSGQQRLFLEAHNAVGWSPNATYLGEYYIVSGAISLSYSWLFIMTQLITSSYLIVSLSKLFVTNVTQDQILRRKQH